MRPILLLSLLPLLGCASTSGSGAPPRHYDIGVVHRAVTTDVPEAQAWFDRGLAMCFGFNHEEAVTCFQRAAELDPECAMAHWGIAYALSPNYNNPEVTPDANATALAALERATSAGGANEAERALVAALGTRFSADENAERGALDQAYARAMREVRAAHPDDADVAALTAEALMQLRPWKLWSPEGEPAPETPEIRTVLEASLERWPEHPALCHLYIHTMEAGPHVAQAIPAARTLEGLTPGLGHLIHMPSHIYTWTGLYDDVVRTNVVAVDVDDAYVDHAGRHNFYTLYRLHNLHFVAYGAMWSGRRALALEYADRIVEEIPADLLQELADFLDVFTATSYHVMVRFGMWDAILDEPEPQMEAARAVWRYARGVALASLGRVAEAEAEEQAFLAAKAAVPETRLLFNNPVSEILAVAQHVLAGEVAYRRGDYEVAFEQLRKAAALDEELNYDEPWGWMEPARHALGALLTEQGRYAEAIEVYDRNLERYPENGWALHGLAECLEGLGREPEAADARARFAKAWAKADVEIPGSCYCKTG